MSVELNGAKRTGFIINESVSEEQMAPGLSRKIMAYDNSVMLVRVEFEKGGVGALHQHHHVQLTNVESGVFEIEIDGEPTPAQLAEVEKAAEVLLSNPVIENYVVRVEK